MFSSHCPAVFQHCPAAWIAVVILIAAARAPAAEPLARPLVVGHRGLLHSAPENTLPAFRACLALRVGFEFDVRRTRDGRLVCLHDDTLDRTTNGHGRLAGLTLPDLLQLDAGEHFAPAFRGERVPTIEEIFKLAGEQATSDTLLAVDLKEAGGNLEVELVRLAESHRCLERLVFIGATIESPEVRGRLKDANARTATARLAADPGQFDEVAADMLADWVYVRFVPTAEQIAKIHQRGKRLFLAGTLVAGHEPDNWRSAVAAGMDAILTDFPLECQQQFRRARK